MILCNKREEYMKKNLNDLPNNKDLENNTTIHAKVKRTKVYLVLKIISILLLLGSLTMIILSFTLDGEQDTYFGLRMGGFLCLPISIFLLFIAFLPNIQSAMIKTNKYIIDKNKENLKEISQQHAEISSIGAKKIAKSITEGVLEQKEVQTKTDSTSSVETITCQDCGEKNEAGSKFCSNCGKSLDTAKYCANCGKKIENDDKFCPHCGQKQ